jgi:uncharacterized protein YuzB (UPF0349 family)
MALIECCLSNVSSDARVALADSDHDIRESLCLDRCGECYARPFLIVEGELRSGGSHHDLLAALDGDPEVPGE